MHINRSLVAAAVMTILHCAIVDASAQVGLETSVLSPPADSDYSAFGSSCDVDGDTLVIGMPGYNGPNGDIANSGGVFVYSNSPTGWQLSAILTHTGALPDDNLGRSVSISGHTILAGAESDEPPGVPHQVAGSAFVFVLDPITGTWSQQAQLISSAPALFEGFGQSVAIDGDLAVVGSWYSPSSVHPGAAHVFRRTGTTWQLEKKLLGADTGPFDFFGRSVDVHNDVVAVGAPQAHSSSSPNPQSRDGACYVFRYNGSDWIQEAKLEAEAPSDLSAFGHAISVGGNTIAVGAPVSGFVQVFDRSPQQPGAWIPASKLEVCGHPGLLGFGSAISLAGDLCAIGSVLDQSGATQGSGAAYLFARNSNHWTQQDKLEPSVAKSGDQFGFAVATDGLSVVASSLRDYQTVAGTGYAVAFSVSGTCVSASATTYGVGCPGTIETPQLTMTPVPRLGSASELRLTNSRGTVTSAIVLIGAQPASIPRLGCLGLVAPAIVFNIPTLPSGELKVPVVIPCAPFFCGTGVYLQAIEEDPGSPNGVASFTPGLQLVLGT
jgi:hypothetical protein